MAVLSFTGAGYIAPAGVGLVLAFGGDGGAAPKQTADKLTFWQTPYEAPENGIVNLQFGVTNEGGAGPPAIAVAVQASLQRPVGSAFISGTTPIITVAELPGFEPEISVLYDINVERGPTTLTAQPVTNARGANEENRQVVQQSPRLRAEPFAQYEKAQRLREETFSPYSESDSLRCTAAAISDKATAQQGERISARWEIPQTTRASAAGQFERALATSTVRAANFENSKALREEAAALFEQAANFSKRWETDFQQGHTCNWFNRIRYEEAGLALPHRKPPPLPPVPPEPLPNGIYDLQFGPPIPASTDIVFGVPFYNTNTVFNRGFYIVQNSAQIVRASDGRDVPAQGVNLSVDVDGYAWQMRAQLAGRDAIDLFEGTEADPFAALEIDVIINGYTWRIVVDAWSRSQSWGEGSVTITGRSRSAYLAAPYVEPRDYTLGAQRLVQQCAADEMPPGWQVNWTANDWLLPADAFSYSGLTPIGAISTLAQSAAAFIEPDRQSNVLRVKPLYPSAPWLWGALTPDHVISNSFVIKSSSEKQPGEGIDGLYVHGGEVGGVLAKVQRTGTGGVTLGQTIIDPLITTVGAARELGIAAIAATSRQSSDIYEMALSPEYGGLITPGDLIAFGDSPGASFIEDSRGMVRGTTVRASASRNANGVALDVRQSINVERHLA